MRRHKRGRRTGRAFSKKYDDIILAYGSTESIPSPGMVNLGYPGEDCMPGRRVTCITQQQHYPYNGMTDTGVRMQPENSHLQQWNELVPIDEGPELIYASQKAMESRLNELRKKKPRFNLKSKSMDDLCMSLRCAARGMKLKKKRRPPPIPGGSSGVNTSMESIESDNSDSALGQEHQDQISRIMYETIEDMYSIPGEEDTTRKAQRLSQSTPAFYENVPVHVSTISRSEGHAMRKAMYKDAIQQEYDSGVPTYEDVGMGMQGHDQSYEGVILNHNNDVIAL